MRCFFNIRGLYNSNTFADFSFFFGVGGKKMIYQELINIFHIKIYIYIYISKKKNSANKFSIIGNFSWKDIEEVIDPIQTLLMHQHIG